MTSPFGIVDWQQSRNKGNVGLVFGYAMVTYNFKLIKGHKEEGVRGDKYRKCNRLSLFHCICFSSFPHLQGFEEWSTKMCEMDHTVVAWSHYKLDLYLDFYDVDFCQCVKWGIAFKAYCGLRVMIDLPLQSGLQVFPDRRPCGAAKFNRF